MPILFGRDGGREGGRRWWIDKKARGERERARSPESKPEGWVGHFTSNGFRKDIEAEGRRRRRRRRWGRDVLQDELGNGHPLPPYHSPHPPIHTPRQE